jgi:nicotinate phosphoribosyltransferase
MPATALHTDLYQLTMTAGYIASGHAGDVATFELFVRRMPPSRAYLLAAGLETALDYILSLSFSDDDVRWMRTLPALQRVPETVFEFLRQYRFSGDVWALPEGTPFFPNEPLVRVTAPIGEAQLLETALLAIVNFETSIASKGARVVAAAGGRPVIEFGGRRAHGPDAAVLAARAAYVAGCAGTSFVEAGRLFGIPLSGTMAHSWVLAFPTELEAFTRYAELFGSDSTLLLDTYDTVAAANAVASSGLRPPAVRIDSGDLLDLSRAVRQIFDAAGLRDTRILVSGELDEFRIAELLGAGAPIDAFGVGTALSTSEDAPALGGVYKLVQIASRTGTRDVMKRSAGKATWPGRKQVHRIVRDGTAVHDVVALDGESVSGRPLLEQVVAGGRRTGQAPSLAAVRTRTVSLLGELPAALKAPDAAPEYEVRVSDGLGRRLQAGPK